MRVWRSRMRILRLRWTGLPVLALVAITSAWQQRSEPYLWDIPAPFPRPPVPAGNPMTVDKVELGRYLFYDTRLSVNRTQSCATCHRQELAFTDGRARSIGATGAIHPRSSMSLANVAWNAGLTWAHPALDALEEQALVPLLGTDPVEMGMRGLEQRFADEARRDTVYRRLFPLAFPASDDPYTLENAVSAIAAFERTLISLRSPYDRYRYGNERDAISDAAKRGERLFFSSRSAGCFQCHGGWNFSGEVRREGHTDVAAAFFNNGLYNIAGETSYPAPNTGLHAHTGRPEDVGKFRPPTLRNIAVTAPYMHDGSIVSLEEVLDHYAAGGRTITSGPYAGDGSANPNRSPSVHGFDLTAAEKQDLIAFLHTLTDSVFLTDPALSNPWK